MKRTLLFLIALTLPLAAQTPAPGHPEKPDASEAEKAFAAYRASAVARAKQVIVSLMEFDDAYGRFPCAETVKAVKENTGTNLSLKDTSSNQLFRQLIATGIKSEEIFCFNPPGKPQPDNQFGDDVHILAAGECSIAYVAGRSSSCPPEMPLLLAPLIKGKMTFDPKPFSGKALVAHREGWVEMLPIGPDGKVRDANGKDILDPDQKYWEGKKPEIRYPE